jgi:Pyruvate/2-oxoacid:ferredoxin oxidoreductase delta subunit
MSKDLYEDLAHFYEFMLGPLAQRDAFIRALQDTIGPDELRVFFLLPMTGWISQACLQKKAGLSCTVLVARVNRLAAEGLVMAYTADNQPVYERANPIYMTEQQVRKAEDTPRRDFYARFFNQILIGEAAIAAPTRTPYYRVLPVEMAVTGVQGGRVIPIDVPIPDPRGVLPLDVVSEMIRRDARLIGVADCYCRRARRLVGEGCDHPVETCLVFNKGAESLIEHGTARRIELDEALRIVADAEQRGLVHNVDNCEGTIGSICNCCSCCCVLLRTWQRGLTNADSPSRYRVTFNAERCQQCGACVARCPTGARSLDDGLLTINDERCLGCGLCVAGCPQGANAMVLRESLPQLARTADDLYRQIGREAIVGMADNVRDRPGLRKD